MITCFIAIQSCSSFSSASKLSSLGGIIIPEPTPVDFKSEAVITRLNDIIQRADISDTQRAELYYERGIKYDSVGLSHLARLDFNHALRLKPNHANAYNFLGVHLTQIQEFNYAYEAFDSAIELVNEHDYAYFNRGFALYYGARPELALEDFTYFYQRKTDDVYRILWLYFAANEIDPINAKQQLKQNSLVLNNDDWATQIIHLYLGEITQQDLIDNLSTYNALKTTRIDKKVLNERLCETYFYLGKYNLLMNNVEDAEMFFKLALSTNVYEYVEHRFSRLELDLIEQVSKASY